jgi:hypothetical protein
MRGETGEAYQIGEEDCHIAECFRDVRLAGFHPLGDALGQHVQQ